MPTPLRIVASSVANAAVYGVLLFGPARTLHWDRAWILVLGAAFAMMLARVAILRDGGALFAQRRRPPFQAGQPAADKALVAAFLVVIPAYIAFVPIDVFRLHLLPPPPNGVTLAGLALAAAGMTVIAFAFRENAFAVGVVTLQRERGQAVVDRGVYAVVRHPLYAGVALTLVGGALWLQSSAAAIGAIVPVALMAVRIVVEERFLVQKLPGYRAYTERTRSRLVPRIW